MSSANFIKERLKQIENFLYNNKAKVWKIALEHTIIQQEKMRIQKT